MDAPRNTSRQKTLSILVLVCTSILVYLVLVQPWSLRQASLPYVVGEVADKDLRAKRDIQYVSEVLTEAARAEAERTVAAVYIPPDPAIARAQIKALSATLHSIDVIRAIPGLTDKQKNGELMDLPGLALQPSSYDLLLALSDARWELVQNEALNVLDQTMRNPVRSENLDTIRQDLSSLVSYKLMESEAGLVVDLVSPLVAVNSFYSPDLTDAARQAARNAVTPVVQSFVTGQMVVPRGHVITATDLEALTATGLVQGNNPLFNLFGAAALVVVAVVFTLLYFFRRQPVLASDLRGLILLAILFVVFLLGVRVVIPNRTVAPYLFPVPAFALLVAALFGSERGMIFGLLMSVLAAYGNPDALSLMPYYTLSSLCGVLALGQGRRLIQFVYAALGTAAAGIAIVIAYRLAFTDMDWVGTATLIVAALGCGVLSAVLSLPLQFLLAQFLGMTTALQLLEISRPDSPLLNYFLRRAPGTYQHSLQVANLAEQAAEKIRADALLTRVGALYHDIGKAANPLFFVENQPPSQIDSHDALDPIASAETIIRHVTDGLEMAHKYRLPQRLHDFIAEHHGTLITRYQYNFALQAADGDPSKVDEKDFRYPGPTPRSKETALLMFADGVEARARAERPTSDEMMRDIVNNVIERCRKDGQLEQAPLSQRDMTAIAESFVATLRVTYHPRLEYPREPFTVQLDVPTVPNPARKRK